MNLTLDERTTIFDKICRLVATKHLLAGGKPDADPIDEKYLAKVIEDAGQPSSFRVVALLPGVATPLPLTGSTADVTDGRAELWFSGANFEDGRHRAVFNEQLARTDLAMELFRARDRLEGFADAPVDELHAPLVAP